MSSVHPSPVVSSSVNIFRRFFLRSRKADSSHISHIAPISRGERIMMFFSIGKELVAMIIYNGRNVEFIIIPRRTIVAGYYGITLVARVSVHLSVRRFVRPSVCRTSDRFCFFFSPNLVYVR